MKRIRRAISVLLVLTIVFSINIMSAALPELQRIFTVKASAVDEVISKYAPSGTRDLAVDGKVTSSSYYSSGDGHWELERVNDGALYYNGEDGYNGKAGYTTSPEEVYYHPENMTEAEKAAAVAESKTKPWWMIFDLEGYYDISRMTLFTHGAFPDSFNVEVSSDGETWILW